MCVWGGGGMKHHIIAEGLHGSTGLACSVGSTDIFSPGETQSQRLKRRPSASAPSSRPEPLWGSVCVCACARAPACVCARALCRSSKSETSCPVSSCHVHCSFAVVLQPEHFLDEQSCPANHDRHCACPPDGTRE